MEERRRGRRRWAFFLTVLCNDNDIIDMNNARSATPPRLPRHQRTVTSPPPAPSRRPTIKNRASDGDGEGEGEGISSLAALDQGWNTDLALVSARPCSLRSDNIDITFLLLLFSPPV